MLQDDSVTRPTIRVREMLSVGNMSEDPVVFFDIALGVKSLGRVKIKLFKLIVPKTAENFRQFCTGEYREGFQPVGYKNSTFHRVISGKLVQGGDFVSHNGLGSKSIYGSQYFEDEGFQLSHEVGLVSMANSGPNTNGCQFFITLEALSELNGKNVVFGQVIEGLDIIRLVSKVQTDENNKPGLSVKISECGEY